MKVSFNTKEESKKIQQQEFLKLTGAERIYRFLELMVFFNKFPTKKIKEKNNNFVIEIKVN